MKVSSMSQHPEAWSYFWLDEEIIYFKTRNVLPVNWFAAQRRLLPCWRVYLEVVHAAGAGWGGTGGFGRFGGSDMAVRYSIYWGV